VILSVPEIIATRSSAESRRTKSSLDFLNTSWKELGLKREEEMACRERAREREEEGI
jgi:hypothetical protein